jgi:hypothetical protein
MSVFKKHGFSFSKNFFTSRNLDNPSANQQQQQIKEKTNDTTTASSSSVLGGGSSVSEEIKKLNQKIVSLEKKIKDIEENQGHFGQQLATIKPKHVYSDTHDAAALGELLDSILKKPNTVVVMGATWCKFCKQQGEVLEKLPPGTLSYIIYLDTEGKLAGLLKQRGYNILKLPSIFKTTSGGTFKLISVGLTPIESLISKLI